jgi:hypothetical protein
LTGVKGRAGDWIDQLSFDFVNLKTGEFETSEEVGGNGGGEFFWQVPHDTELASIVVWSVPGNYVHGIQFHLHNSHSSPLFGKETGDRLKITLKGKRVAGFGGRKGDYLDQVRFYIKDREE